MVHNDNNPNRGIATVFYTYQYLPERRQEKKKKDRALFICFVLLLSFSLFFDSLDFG